MTIRESIQRARAAQYIGTSIVALTETEYTNYLTELINQYYPHLKYWSDVFTNTAPQDLGRVLHEALASYITYRNSAEVDLYIDNLKENYSSIIKLYSQLTRAEADDGTFDLHEWWLCTPVGPASCSRDIGELRSKITSGLGDEWGWDIEIAVFNYQIQNAATIPLATGYACAETLRRLRLDT